ncbi:MAG: 30S ribosomal protein S3 [Candidatus Bathyarchaeota archaeon]|nr:30S ribosomal protein S3 [Candidatus Bathyarchaeota archaeon]
MSIVKRFITEAIKKTEIDEFLKKRLERSGYGGVDISKTPLGTHIVVYAMRPGLVIGRGGETIKELAVTLEQNFKLPNPQISVSEIEVPEFNAFVVASRISSALQRGIHFRRAGYWALNQVMDAGALGVEIVISGKLRTERARFEKFRAGYFPRCGDPALKNMKKAEVHVQLKPGILGVRVKIMPANVQFPDKIKINEPAPPEEIPIIEEKKIETFSESKVKIEEVPVEKVDTKIVKEVEVPKVEVPKVEVPKVEVPKKSVTRSKKTSEVAGKKASEKKEAKK